MKQLLEAGVHFGHQTRRWNPKMAPLYLYRKKWYIHIDLQNTKENRRSMQLHKRNCSRRKKTLYLLVLKQAQEAIQEEAVRCDMHFVNNRWLGGMLTNFYNY